LNFQHSGSLFLFGFVHLLRQGALYEAIPTAMMNPQTGFIKGIKGTGFISPLMYTLSSK
jgi:hypothetical protein